MAPPGGPQELGRVQKFIEPKMAMIVGDKTDLHTQLERQPRTHLEVKFGDVDVYDDADIDAGTANLLKYDLVLVFQSVVDANVDELKGLGVPILSFNGSVSADVLDMAGGSSPRTGDVTKITDNTHNITRLRQVGNLTIYNTGTTIDHLTTLGARALSLAEDPGDTANKDLVVVDRGALLHSGVPAPETRVHFGYFDWKLSREGKELFDEAVTYCLLGKEVARATIGRLDESLVKPYRFGLGLTPFREGARRGIEAWYLRTGGDDANDGKSWETAKATMASILSDADFQEGDHVYVEGGFYAEALDINVADVEIYGVPETPWSVPGPHFSHGDGHRISADGVKVFGLYFQNGTVATATGNVLSFGGIQGVLMVNCRFLTVENLPVDTTSLSVSEFRKCLFDADDPSERVLYVASPDLLFERCYFTAEVSLYGGSEIHLVDPVGGGFGVSNPSITIQAAATRILNPRGFNRISITGPASPFIDKTPVWRGPTTGTHTTTSGSEETMINIQPNFPNGARAVIHVRLVNMVAGDDFVFNLYKSDDGGTTYDLIDRQNLTDAQAIDHLSYDEHLEEADTRLQLRIQRNSGTNRSFDWVYNVKE